MHWKMPNKTVTAVLFLLVLAPLATGSGGDDKSLHTRTASRCTNCSDHEPRNIEQIKASILNKLGMKQPPDFGGRVSKGLPPLQDIIRKDNIDHSGSVVVLPHIRHRSHHLDATDDSTSDLQSDEATAYSRG